MKSFIDEWQKEIREPVEIAKSAFKLAGELYYNNPSNNPKVKLIYEDIAEIKEALTLGFPCDYATLNSKITEKYSSIPPVGNITFYKVSLDVLQSKTIEENKRTLALIAQSLSQLMTNVKIGQTVEIFANVALKHIETAGFNTVLKI